MKKEETHETKQHQEVSSNDNGLSIVSLVLGVISLTGPGLVLGIPAIITGWIALKKKQGERGLSIAGIVTGIVSTVISLLVIGFFLFLLIWAGTHPDAMRDMERQQQAAPPRDVMMYERS
jgi:hypothetical protein